MAEKTLPPKSGTSSEKSTNTSKNANKQVTKPAAAAQKSASKVNDCPEQPCTNCTRRIEINLETHVLHAYEIDKNGKETERFVFNFVDGRSPHPHGDFSVLKDKNIEIHCTPDGKYKVKSKYGSNYKSKKYKSPMPYVIFFTDRGEGIHQGDISKRAEHMAAGNPTLANSSHGCVRIGEKDAKALNCWAQLDDLVIVIASKPKDKALESKTKEQKNSNQKADRKLNPKRGEPYKIQAGDTLYDISQRSGATIEQIKKVNPTIKDGVIKVGDTIQIPN